MNPIFEAGRIRRSCSGRPARRSFPMPTPVSSPESVEQVTAGLRAAGYLPGANTALVSFLATKLDKPILVEGPAGVGKTELAKALSRYLGRSLIRLQCYEGLDEAKALYEWNYRKQLLRIQTEPAGATPAGTTSRPTSSARSSCSHGR